MMTPLIVYALFLLGAAAAVAFWVWMIIDCATREPAEGNERLIWILIIVLAHWIGALIYYFVRRPKRIDLYGT
jgi:hypothetical protein